MNDKSKNNKAITKAISTLDVINYETVAKLIPSLITDGSLILDLSDYIPTDPTTNDDEGIGKYLIYDHEDKENPFSIWAFAIAAGQKTSIHDHRYKGTVIVLKGPVTEHTYQPTGDDTARLIRRVDRHKFHCNGDDLEDTFVHQLRCRKDLGIEFSVTLHIYNMRAYITNVDNEKIIRRNLNNIYVEEQSMELPPYEEERA